MEMYLEPLGITTPHAGFNGGQIVAADNKTILDELVIPEDAAAQAVEHMTAAGLDVWVFAGSGWYVKGSNGPYVAHEAEVTRNTFTVVEDFAPYLGRTNKIMASSKTFDLVGRVESQLQARLDAVASVNRSSPYYCDVTNVDANKGRRRTRTRADRGRSARGDGLPRRYERGRAHAEGGWPLHRHGQCGR